MTEYDLTLMSEEYVKLRGDGVYAIETSFLRLLWMKHESGILNTSAVTNTFQNLNTELEQSMTWPWPRQKVKLRKRCVLFKSSNPKAGVGQILELYLEYFSSYVHFSKLKCKT